MVYTMKREILMMFKNMNEKLFDALPTMIMDEEMDKEGLLEQHISGPGPYNRKETKVDGETFVDGMRVASKEKIWYPSDDALALESTCKWSTKEKAKDLLKKEKEECKYFVGIGEMGTVELHDAPTMSLTVIWDRDEHLLARPMDGS